jgi:hypothetical protein
MKPTHSRRLRQKLEGALPELMTATSAVIQHPRFRELYVDFAVTLHQMIRASVPLMRAAHRRALELASSDPVAAAMVPYLDRHIREEMHHDDWLLEDLESIGVPRAAVLARMPPSAVASMIGAHYYWIHHHHPVAQLGQIATIEGYPATVDVIDRMVERTGFPRAAFRTFEKHTHLDPNHRDEFDRALDAMPLTDEHHEILAVSAVHTARLAARAYRAIVQRAAMPVLRRDLTIAAATEDRARRVHDPLRGATYAIGEEEDFLLASCDGRQAPDEVCRAFGERFGTPLERRELEDFLGSARAEHWFAEEGTA